MTPRVALVQDHLVQRGGGDRVMISMAEAFPGAPIHTAFFWPEETFEELGALDVRVMPIGRIPALARHHRLALPVLAPAFDRLRVDADVVVCGSSGWAAGVRTSGRKVVYFHALARWLHEREAYLAGRGPVARLGVRALDRRLRRWDDAAVRSADRLLVYSSSMRDAVGDTYGLDAEVLPPPVTVDVDGPRRDLDLEPGYVLCPCRLMAYKNVDVVLQAFRDRPDDRLVVAGGGPDESRLRSLAPPNVTFVGATDDAGMRWLYANCRMAVSAAYEPFGLVTLEANAFGRPAAVLRGGGFRDTVVEGSTGTFFDELAPSELGAAVDAADRLEVRPAALARHAAGWSEEAFVERLRSIVDDEAAVAGAR